MITKQFVLNTIKNNLTEYGFNPYARIQMLKQIPILKLKGKNLGEFKNGISFSIIVTVKNETKRINDFLSSLEIQTKKPNEIIIVDGGSTDDTIKIIEEFSSKSKLIIKISKLSSANIAKGRNVGINLAKNEFIVITDAGCVLDEKYCEYLLKGFLYDKEIDLVGGIYKSENKNWKQKFFSNVFIFEWKDFDFKEFLPSSRSVAFKKSLFKKCGGYPEWLTLTGEDTLFDINYRRISKKWAFVTDAIVHWDSPNTLGSVLKLAYNYGKGDGESGVGDFSYFMAGKWKQASRKRERKIFGIVFVPLFLLNSVRKKGIVYTLTRYKMIKGYLDGKYKKIELFLKNRNVKGNVLIFSGVPFSDSGGGQRGTQIALNFIKRGYKVTFVNIYPSYEKAEKIFFDIDYTLLELDSIKLFSIDEYIVRHKNMLNNSLAILEFPHPLFVQYIDTLQEKGVKVIYDCIDNWSSSLGGKWYEEEIEKKIVNKSDILITTAEELKNKIKKISNEKTVHLLRNAVNLDLFNPKKNFVRPKGLPQFDSIIMYVGALWGKWFDWDLLKLIAEKFSKSAIVCIGNYNNECPFKLPNVFFLGLKQQIELPNYLKYADVCIIPFKLDKITESTSPLKVYEYLRMQKPVVCSDMNELRGIPYVYTSKNNEEFLQNISIAQQIKINENEIENFLYQNSWENRISSIIQLCSNSQKLSNCS